MYYTYDLSQRDIDAAQEALPVCVRDAADVSPDFHSGSIMAVYADSRDEVTVLLDGNLVRIKKEIYEYICWEAQRRGVSEATVYREELRAEEELQSLSLSHDELADLAGHSTPRAEYLEGNEDCPF